MDALISAFSFLLNATLEVQWHLKMHKIWHCSVTNYPQKNEWDPKEIHADIAATSGYDIPAL